MVTDVRSLELRPDQGVVFGRLVPLTNAEEGWAAITRPDGAADKIAVDPYGFFVVKGKAGKIKILEFGYGAPDGMHTIKLDAPAEFEIIAGQSLYLGQVIFSPITAQVFLTDDFIRDRVWFHERFGEQARVGSSFPNLSFYALMERYFRAPAPAPRVEGERAFVPGASFLMGDVWPGAMIKFAADSAGEPFVDGSQIPPHEVMVSAFWIDLYPVTVAALGRGAEARAADQIAWADTDKFCRERGGRLPTEAEWELAARGPAWGAHLYAGAPSPGREIGGNEMPVVGPEGWTQSPYGAYFNASRLVEWTGDWFAGFRGEPANNPTGPATGDRRAARAGPYRFAVAPDGQIPGLGFRCAYPEAAPAANTASP